MEQHLRLLQIARVEAFCEPPVNRSKQFASLVRLTLVTPEACEAHGGAQLPGLCLLGTSYRKCMLKIAFCFFRIRRERLECDFPGNAMHLFFPALFLRPFYFVYRVVNA